MVLLSTVAALVLWTADSIWSTSADLAHHYALVARLSEYWTLPAAFDRSLGEMNSYPRASHAIAAVIGTLFGSPMIGLQLVTLLSLIVLWASFVYALLSFPRSVGLAASAALAAALLANAFVVRLEAHGGEVVGNFFFAQLVGQAIVALAVTLALYAERSGVSRVATYCVLLGALLPVLDVHLLPAVELLGTVVMLIVVDALGSQKESRAVRAKLAALACLVALGAGAAVVSHPSFQAMKAISANDGGLTLRYAFSAGRLMLLSLVVAATGAIAVFKWTRLPTNADRRALLLLKYFGAYAIAVSGLCLLQLAALKAGYGSAYAAKKYAFALHTALLLFVALVPVIFRRAETSQPGRPEGQAHAYPWWLAPLLIAVAFVSVVPSAKVLSLSAVVHAERQLQSLRETVLAGVSEKQDYAVRLFGMPSTVAYMLSIGILKAPRSDIAYDILFNRQLRNLSTVHTLITSESQPPYDIPACRRFVSATSLVVLDADCVAGHLHQLTRCEGTFDFSSNGWVDDGLLRGFSWPEPHGRWTDGRKASFKCAMPKGKPVPKLASIDVTALLYGTPEQRVVVSANDAAPVEYRFAIGTERRVIEVPLPQRAHGDIHIDLLLPDARSPQSRGLNSDPREIAVSVRSIAFE
jgi:hypothetical protein